MLSQRSAHLPAWCTVIVRPTPPLEERSV